MKLMVLDPFVTDDLIARRRRLGLDHHDEVWDGVYVMSPPPNVDHQDLVGKFCRIFAVVVPERRRDRVIPGAGVSDRNAGWEHNYRVPDVLVALADGLAVNRGTHWQGGPDLLVEIMSPGDDTLVKLPFYAALGVREVLVLDRDTREPVLYRLGRRGLAPVRPADLDGTPFLVSRVLPLAFRRVEKRAGPRLEVRRTDGRKKAWTV